MEEVRDEGYVIEYLNEEGEWTGVYRCLSGQVVDSILNSDNWLSEKQTRVRHFTSQVIDWPVEKKHHANI